MSDGYCIFVSWWPGYCKKSVQDKGHQRGIPQFYVREGREEQAVTQSSPLLFSPLFASFRGRCVIWEVFQTHFSEH